ncbi:zinc finger and SCAN domain-containing protein 10 isoform X2 [Folsomia candida]|uniref:zinc finger and SCAN domain-containing protein 10 isoform X2 n=1 Tax=Folsomia candida TaxID=158441 RepID=UPI0016054C89|nr:zinc finger and SCAN domain-containing protein 10 isoform X2 [Folsomia candida]
MSFKYLQTPQNCRRFCKIHSMKSYSSPSSCPRPNKCNAKENCKQSSGSSSVFYQCDKCDSFFYSKPLVVTHLSKTGHGKQEDESNSVGWRTVPFPTPILKLDRTTDEIVEVTDDPPQFAPPPFVPVKMAKFKFKTISNLADPLGEIDSEHPGEILDDSDESTPPSSPEIVQENSELRPTCEKCKLSFSSLHALQTHQFLITNCASRAAELARLRRRRNGPPKPRRCRVCGIMCRSHAHYDRHAKTHRERSLGALTCDTCGASFCNNFSLERHQIRGSCTTPKLGKECRKCGRTFTQSGSLKRHLENDSCFKGPARGPGAAKKKCDTCGLSFTQSGSLKRHLENDNCFKGPSRAVRKACGKCGLAFAQSRSLKFHLEKDCKILDQDGSQEDDIAAVVVKDEEIIQAEVQNWSELFGLNGGDFEEVVDVYDGGD